MKTMIRAFVTMALLTPASVLAAPAPWKAGIASIKITPDIPLPMAGYDSRTKPFTNVEHNIYAKALALEDEQGQRAVLITTDLLGLSRAIAEPVCERIQKDTKLSRSQIL